MILKQKFLTATSALLLTLFIQPASAAIIYNDATGTAQNSAGGVSTFLVQASELAGMTIQGFFSDGTSETLVWAATGGSTGGATSISTFSIGGGGNALNTASIGHGKAGVTLDRFVMDAGAGNAIFDTGGAFIGAATRTPNTNIGSLLSSSFDALNILTVNYSDVVGVGGAAAVGDIFRTMEVVIAGGLAANTVLDFNQDMDALDISGDIGTPVPGPASILIFGLGLLGLASTRRIQ